MGISFSVPGASLLAPVERKRAAVNDRLPEWLVVGWLILHIRTGATDAVLDRLRPVWPFTRHAYSVGIVSTILLALLMLVVFAGIGIVVLERGVPTNHPASAPRNYFLIPGVNDYLPVAATGFVAMAVVVAVSVHELSHAFAAEQAGIDPDQFGVALLFGVVPLGAYVRFDDDEDDVDVFDRLSYRDQMRVFAAGILANVVVGVLGVIAFALVDASLMAVNSVYVGPALEPTSSSAVASVSLLGNLLFWLVVLNFNFALVNAVPVYPLDGGLLFRTAVAGILDSVGVTRSEHYATMAAVALSGFFVANLVLWFIAPYLEEI